MRTCNKSNMIVIEAASGAELESRYNSAMSKLALDGVTVEDRIISLEKLSAIILYAQKVKIPENMKDEFHLKGIFPRCQDCPHYDGGGRCDRMRSDSAPIRDDDDICNYRWMELEKELERRTYAKKSESGDGTAWSDPRKAC